MRSYVDSLNFNSGSSLNLELKHPYGMELVSLGLVPIWVDMEGGNRSASICGARRKDGDEQQHKQGYIRLANCCCYALNLVNWLIEAAVLGSS